MLASLFGSFFVKHNLKESHSGSREGSETMKTVGKSATIAEPRLNRGIGEEDDAAANEQEVEEQIEADNVEKNARENGSGAGLDDLRQ